MNNSVQGSSALSGGCPSSAFAGASAASTTVARRRGPRVRLRYAHACLSVDDAGPQLPQSSPRSADGLLVIFSGAGHVGLRYSGFFLLQASTTSGLGLRLPPPSPSRSARLPAQVGVIEEQRDRHSLRFADGFTRVFLRGTVIFRRSIGHPRFLRERPDRRSHEISTTRFDVPFRPLADIPILKQVDVQVERLLVHRNRMAAHRATCAMI